MWQQCTQHNQPTFSCSSLVKSKSTWLQLEALRFEGKKRYLCCINIVRTTQSLQMEISAHFVRAPDSRVGIPVGVAEEFYSPVIRCLFHPHVTAVACKRPWSFCQKCRWQVTPKQAYTLNPTKSEWATMLLCRDSVGTYEEINSHTTC